MSLRVGLDVGSTSVKLGAILSPDVTQELLEPISESSIFRFITPSSEKLPGCSLNSIIVSECRRSLGNPFKAARDLLCEFRSLLPDSAQAVLRITGSGGRRVAEALNQPAENEFKAIACGVSALYPQVRTVFEMGGENSKYIL